MKFQIVVKDDENKELHCTSFNTENFTAEEVVKLMRENGFRAEVKEIKK